jgi:rhodanese-related sulfurtransferase
VNEEANEVEALEPGEVARLVDEGAQLIDVRTQHEWDAGHLAGAVHISFEQLSEHAEGLDKERLLVLYCRGGNRSGVAAAALRGAGYDAHHMAGGITAWAEAERPLEPPEGYVAESGEAAAVLEARRREAAAD